MKHVKQVVPNDPHKGRPDRLLLPWRILVAVGAEVHSSLRKDQYCGGENPRGGNWGERGLQTYISFWIYLIEASDLK